MGEVTYLNRMRHYGWAFLNMRSTDWCSTGMSVAADGEGEACRFGDRHWEGIRLRPPGGLHHVYFGNEAVTAANYRPDEARISRVVAQGCAQLIDRSVDAVLRFYEDSVAPQPLVDNFPADELSGVLEQQEQQLHGDAFHFQGHAGSSQLAAIDIQLKLFEGEVRLSHPCHLTGEDVLRRSPDLHTEQAAHEGESCKEYIAVAIEIFY
jgi:hypothetical protein